MWVWRKCATWKLEFPLEDGQIDILYYVTWLGLVIHVDFSWAALSLYRSNDLDGGMSLIIVHVNTILAYLGSYECNLHTGLLSTVLLV